MQQLRSDQHKFRQYKNELNACYSESPSLLKDTTIDSSERKTKILSSSKSVMKKRDLANSDSFRLIKSNLKLVFKDSNITKIIQGRGTLTEITQSQLI